MGWIEANVLEKYEKQLVSEEIEFNSPIQEEEK